MTQETKLIGIIIAVIVVILAIGVFVVRSPNSNVSTIDVDKKILLGENPHILGQSSAKAIVVVEFGDYQCPACARAHLVTKKIIKEYNGKIGFIYRHLPLRANHKNAQIAAEAAEAAGAQGKFWQMHDALYENQADWSELADPGSFFMDLAKKLGFDLAMFKQDLNTHKFAKRVQKDLEDSNALAINSTPTFFINNKQISGFSYDDLKSIIESQLQKQP